MSENHLGDANKMVCVHCGMPADRNQNGIQGYRCGSSYCESFRPQWARSMTCLEIENKKLKGDLDLSYFGEDALIANVRNLRAHIKRLEEAGDAMLNAWLMPEDSMEYCDWVALSADAKIKWQRAKEDKL